MIRFVPASTSPLLLAWMVVSLLAPVDAIDRRIQSAVQSGRHPTLEGPMRAATDVGKPVVVLGGLLAVAAFTGPLGGATARHALFALLPTNVVVEVLKRSVNRTRPDGSRKRSNASFPSSHAANAAAIAAALGSRWPRLRPFLWLLVGTVGWSRIYLNRHFLSDVLVAVVIGIVCAWLVGRQIHGKAQRQARFGT
ncbi:MAG TPA: phosphatase PAP2 family protein [Candidatus Limnocylindria bacterium]|nr:phosphatase PAP2 family protein [Candidatus Limnocylindria bacterium]